MGLFGLLTTLNAPVLGAAIGVPARDRAVAPIETFTAAEYGRLHPELTLFTYLHLAAAAELTEALLASGATGIAYETVRVGSFSSLDRILPHRVVAKSASPLALRRRYHRQTRDPSRGRLFECLRSSGGDLQYRPVAFTRNGRRL